MKTDPPCNRLGNEKSPYLLQHKYNPVCWYPWGEEAFEAARKQNKPIFLSIGYSTCYWCHMMEKDSFELEEVAEVMNAHFVNIKVDREERPDIDQIYMDAVMGLTGHGGWPMSVFLTPDKKPFYGGTFFWKKQFIELLKQIHEAWENKQDQLQNSAEKITGFLQKQNPEGTSQSTGNETFRVAFQQLESLYDSKHGGFGGAPKFPPSAQVELLLRIYRRTENKQALEMAEFTLQQMARGGIYDHIGGGFHRYSTDAEWLAPHFEKMLYDNALLTITYLEAYQVTEKNLYREVATETLEYLLRDMQDPEGGFHSAEDAGEVEKEGEYYTWPREDLKTALNEQQLKAMQKTYDISEKGNFEHSRNILAMHPGAKWEDRSKPDIQEAFKILYKLRLKREPPHRDDKILSGWNGLALSAFARGYQTLREERYLKTAQKIAKFIQEKLFQKNSLLRRYRKGEARFEGTLEDYAYCIRGFLDLYQSDFDTDWFQFALKLQEIQDTKLGDQENGGYYTSNAEDLIVRQKDFADGALPSPNAVSLLNLMRIFALTLNQNLQKTIDSLFEQYSIAFEKSPYGHAAALHALDFKLDGSREIAIIQAPGDDITQYSEYLCKKFFPNTVIAVKKEEGEKESLPQILMNRPLQSGKTTVYVCEHGSCKFPVTDFKEFQKLVETINNYSIEEKRS